MSSLFCNKKSPAAYATGLPKDFSDELGLQAAAVRALCLMVPS